MSRRSYSGNAVSATLSANIGSTDASFSVSTATGWPSANFVITIDTGGTEEKCLVGSRTGTTLSSVTRGWDSTTAAAHSSGVSVKHTSSATDSDEANAHVNNSSGVHGLTGSVVGTTDTQTLTNKTLTAPVIGDFTSAGHTHAGTSTGGPIPESSVTNLTADLAQRVKLSGTPSGVAAGTGAPAASTGGYLLQTSTTVITYATGGSTINYPTAFPNGVVAPVVSIGDGQNDYTAVVQNGSNTVSSFKVMVFSSGGVEVGAGGGYRINWIVIGW